MIKLLNRIFYKLIDNIEFNIFKRVLKKYNVDFYYKDNLGILSKREYSDNFKYLFKTNSSCDAFPLMISLNEKIAGSSIGIDVGANIGITSIWMSRQCSKVFAFEPESLNVIRLKENLTVNNVSNVKIIQKGLSDTKGEATLNIFNSFGHHSLSDKHVSEPKETQIINVITLDDFCSENSIDFIDFLKIDVEGFEFEVLTGSTEMLSTKKIKLIAFEHSPILFKKQRKSPSQVIRLLQSFQYKIYRLDGTEIKLDNLELLKQEDLYAI